ncbi:uncharacterized protein LOC105248039 [Camponotus floridanus]|uniref:uncharacterized protein LOC105248039 n=1 Tax=Camponotus floridanus TaxID=104421 RepID=UPI00059BA566|nr:uncharacterized protein LOC105248039 [Camponotus floridanus]
MKFIYIVVMLIARTLAEVETWDITEKKNWNVNINHIVDRFNPVIAQFIKKYGLDPLKLPQVERKLRMENPNFSEPMMYKIDLILKSGILKGLSNLKRQNNATLTYADRLLKLDVGFEFKLLQGTYDYVAKVIFRNLKGHIKALTENVRAIMNITFNTTDYTLTLDKFHLQVPSHIKVTIKNEDGSVDWINTAIVYIVTPFFKETITNSVQEEASNEIRKYFNEINHKIAPRKMLTYILKYQLLNQNLVNKHQIVIF